MPKKIIQDIYVVKKSIRMIKKNDVRDGFYSEIKKPVVEEKKPDHFSVNRFQPNNTEHNDTKTDTECECVEEKKQVTKNSLIVLWIICIASVATLLFLLSSAFATATLTVTPKSENITLNDSYNIITSSSTNATATSSLYYEVMTIKKDLSKSLETDGQQYAEKKATGKAILYNNYNTSSQRLINNTRLETKDGLIYRLRTSVEVPGIKTINGVKTPGSVEVDIIADMPGDKYNMKISDLKGDFTIPGFQGGPRYSTFYGRLSTDLTGGFIGNVKTVSNDKIQAGRTELKNNLNTELIKEAFDKVPDQYILFKNNYYIDCNDLPDDSSSGDYKITEECSINSIVFNKDALSAFIATNKINNYDGSKIDIMWNDNDIVTLFGITAQPWTENSLTAKFSGPVKAVWSFDANNILSSIIGQDKSIINTVMENNKNSITEVQATIRPIWRNTFPKNQKNIKIVDTIRDSIK